MKTIRLLTVAALGFLAGCQQPYSHLTYGTWSPRSISRLAVTGGKPEVLMREMVSKELAIDHKTETLFNISYGKRVERLTLDGKDKGLPVIQLSRYPRAMAVDAKRGHIYLALHGDSHDIVRTDLDGGNLTVIVPDAQYCKALAFDTTHQKLYWSRQHLSGVFRANADGSEIELLAEETITPSAIAVDETHGFVFWARSDFPPVKTSRIRRAKLDGSEPVTILPKRLLYIEALAVDPVAGRLFWIERAAGSIPEAHIQSANYDGSDLQTLHSFEEGNFAKSLAVGWLPKEARRR